MQKHSSMDNRLDVHSSDRVLNRLLRRRTPYAQQDADGDGVKNSSDAFPTNASESSDADSDGIGDNSDNCVNTANLDQTDTDGDGTGDACDTEIPTTYAGFPSAYDPTATDSISYTGQTARHMLF